MLTLLTFLPFMGALILVGLPQEQKRLARGLALGFSSTALVLAMTVWLRFEGESGTIQFLLKTPWIPTLGIHYSVGVDGLGLLMVLLTTVVTLMAILASWRIEERVPLYFACVLFLETGLLGAFTALNFFHWFIFYELSLVPAFFLIKLWGGAERSAAATQFFVYTMAGSVAMLVGFMALFLATGTFDFLELAEQARQGRLRAGLEKIGPLGLSAETAGLLVFVCVLLGFAVKVPLMPFHTWLPATYAEATTGTAILLTGAMSKLGVYGLLRIVLPIFQEQMRWMLTPLLLLAVITIVFSACAAFAQKDLKRVLAYSSINHLGYCLLGVFAVSSLTEGTVQWSGEKAAALNGVLLQMFNHGLTAAALFCFVGFIEHRAEGRRGLDDFGGLRQVAPVFCGLMGISVFASLGLPGLNGFVGEFLIFKGVFPLASWAAALSSLGLLITAVFLLTLLQRVFHGPLNPKWSHFGDLRWSERWIVLPATVLMFLLGIWPQLIVGTINATVIQMVAALQP